MTAATVTSVSGSAAQTQGRSEDVFGRRRVGLYRCTLSSSYTTGGEAFNPTSFGFQGPVASVFLTVRSVAASVTRRFEYDFTAKTIIGFVTSTGAEIAAAQNLSTIVVDVLVVGE